MIRKHTRRAAKAAFAISLGVAIVIGLFAAAFTHPRTRGRPRDRRSSIGTKNFPEEFILGQLYKQALEAKGFNVSYKENIGSTELIQTVPDEREDQLLPRVHGRDRPGCLPPSLSAKTANATYLLAKKLEAAKGYTVLKPTPFFDTDVVAVTNATAKKYGLKSIGDLKKVGSFKLGGFPECKTRNTCFVGLHEAVRAHECVVPAARRHLRLRGARRGQGARRRRVLHRPAARQRLEVHRARGPEARDRVPERGSDRQGIGGEGSSARSSRQP